MEQKVNVLEQNSTVESFIRDSVERGIEEEAFYVFNIGDVVRKYEEWIQKLPRVKPYYAIKSNHIPFVSEILNKLGSNIDCASRNEVEKVLSLGVEPERIILSNPCKIRTHIRHAYSKGIYVMAFDSEVELQKIKELAPKARLLLRIKCTTTKARVMFGNKFGCDAKEEAPILLKCAHDMELDVVGVCFHIGLECQEPEAYARGIADAKRVFDVATTIGYKLSVVNLGGGYPGRYDGVFDAIAESINEALEKYFPDRSIDVIAEPGTYFVKTAFTLLCRVHTVKCFEDENGKKNFMYYIDDGNHGSFGLSFQLKNIINPIPLTDHENDPIYPSVIWGPTCDSCDKVMESAQLPELKEGEWIKFESMGNYTFSLSREFNGFGAAKFVSVADERGRCFLKKHDMMHLAEVIQNSS